MGVTPSTRNQQVRRSRPAGGATADSRLSADDVRDLGDIFDPGSFTVEQVKSYVEANPGEAEAIHVAEVEGKGRKGLIAWLEDFLTTPVVEG